MRVFPLELLSTLDASRFGFSEPARARAPSGFDSPEYVLNVTEIARYEGCPLYLVSVGEDNALVDGVRLQLRSGEMVVLADDAAGDNDRFEAVLRQALQGGMVELPRSRHAEPVRRGRRPSIPDATLGNASQGDS